MNTRELCLAVQTQLRARLWDGSGEKVFATNGVLVSLGIDKEVAARVRLPLAVILPLGASPDPEHNQEPGLIKRQIQIRLYASVAGDPWGQDPLLGACRPSTTSSDGAGLLELEEELWATVEILNALESINLLFVSASAAAVQWMDGSKIAVGSDYTFDATITTAASS